MSKKTNKSAIAGHFKKVNRKGYICQIEKMETFVEPN